MAAFGFVASARRIYARSTFACDLPQAVLDRKTGCLPPEPDVVALRILQCDPFDLVH